MERVMGKAGVLPLGPSKRMSCENRPLFDEYGCCHGVITAVVKEAAHVLPDGRAIPDTYCWHMVSRGTLLPYTTHYWTGTKLTKGSKCLALWNDLGMADESLQVDRAIGLPIVFKLERRNGKYPVEAGSVHLDAVSHVQLVAV